MTEKKYYTTQLQAGLGVIEETKTLLSLWEVGMDTGQLYQAALDSGMFPNVTARRLRNVVMECFSPRYLCYGGKPAELLKELYPVLTSREFNQLLYLYTCRANKILYDFVREIYWEHYIGGNVQLSTDTARDFVIRANQDGKTQSPWSDSTLRRVAAYLPGSCADFGLLESGRKSIRDILSFRIESRIVLFLAYELHFSGLGDNIVLAHSDWGLFGMSREDVRQELKRLSLQGHFIVQSAGDVTRIEWPYKSREELINVISQS